MQKRVYDGKKHTELFATFRKVLQEEGHLVLFQDESSGLMVASIQSTPKTHEIWKRWLRKDETSISQILELSVQLDQLSERRVESRISLQRLKQVSLGARRGEEILDPKIYSTFYSQVGSKLKESSTQP
jgi:hypothetical protein